jgi:hypothetical protein
MNFFSIIFLAIIVAIIVFPIFLFLRKRNIVSKKAMAFLPSLIVLLLVLYLHFGLARGFSFVSPDEGIFLQNLKVFEEKNNIFDNHSSGPTAIFFVFWLKAFLGISAEQVMLMLKFLFSFFTPLVIFATIKRVSGNKTVAFFSMLLAFLSNHFIWPFMETRPELFGMPIFFGIILAIEKYISEKKNTGLFVPVILLVSLTTIHFWSMIVSAMAFFFCFFVSKKDQKTSWALSILAISIVFFVSFSFFGIIWDIHFAVRESIGLGGEFNESQYNSFLKLHVLFGEKIKFSFLISALIILPTIAFLVIGLLLKKQIQKAKETAKNILEENNEKIIKIGLFLAVIALLSQIILFGEEVSSQYQNAVVFLLLQAGNIFFVFLFLQGISKAKEQKAENVFYYLFPLLAIIFFAFLTSPIVKTGFHNFAVRTLNYFVPLASIIAFFGFEKITKSSKKTKLITIALIALFVFSIVLGTRDPTIIKRSGFFETVEVDNYTTLTVFLNNHGYYQYDTFEFPHAPEEKALSDSNAFDKIFSSQKRSAYELKK